MQQMIQAGMQHTQKSLQLLQSQKNRVKLDKLVFLNLA